MRKLAIALVAVITTIGGALPVAAQVGFYAVPDVTGISVAVGPGYYVYGQYPLPYQRHFYRWRHKPYVRSWYGP